MRTIYRFPIEITDKQTISMPAGSLPLSVAPSRDSGAMLDLWALVWPDADPAPIVITLIGTGNPTPEHLGVFLGTCRTHAGQFVWHVFWERG